MRKVILLILITVCLFLLASCCPEDTKHISNYELWELTSVYLDDYNTHSYFDFDMAYSTVWCYLEGEDYVTLEEAQQALEVMNVYTNEMKKGLDEARSVLEYIEKN